MKKKFFKYLVTSLIAICSFGLLTSCDESNSLDSYTICNQLNEIIDECASNGEKEYIENKWYSVDSSEKLIDFSLLTGTNGTLRVGVNGDDEPFVYYSNGSWTGLCFDYLYRLCDTYGYQIKIETYQGLSSLIAALKTGKLDIGCGAISITEERAEEISFSHAFMDNVMVCVTTKDNESINSIEDLTGKKVGILTGTIYDEIIQAQCPEAEIYRYNQHVDYIEALEKGKVDCVLTDFSVFRFLNLYHTSLEVRFQIEGDDSYGYMLPKFGYQYVNELDNKRIGILEGSIYESLARNRLSNPIISEYKDLSSLALALQTNKLDAFICDKYVTGQAMRENENIYFLDEPLQSVDSGAIFPKTEEGFALKTDFDDYIDTLRANGKLEEIVNKWENYVPGETQPEFIVPIVGSNRTINLSVNAVLSPYVFVEDNSYVGLDIDLVKMFCSQRNYSLQINNMDFAALIPSLSKNDMAISCISYTEERAESVYFSKPLYQSDISFAVSAETTTSENIFESIADSFTKTFIRESRWRLFTKGTAATLVITFASVVLGLALGFALYLFAYRTGNIGRKILNVYTAILHNVPLVVILMIFYYIIFGKSSLSGVAISTVVFALAFSASVYSMLDTSVKAIGVGQFEASTALGYSRNQTFFKIIFPQTLQQFIPMLKGEIVAHLKGTAIVGYVAVEDLTKMSDIVRSRTYESFFPLIVTALIYFGLAALLIWVVKLLNSKIEPKKRKQDKILKGVKEHD